MNREERRVENVRRRMVESAHSQGIDFVHTGTHLNRSLIIDLVMLLDGSPDPTMVVLGLYETWKDIGTDYIDFVTYAKGRIRQR